MWGFLSPFFFGGGGGGDGVGEWGVGRGADGVFQ